MKKIILLLILGIFLIIAGIVLGDIETKHTAKYNGNFMYGKIENNKYYLATLNGSLIEVPAKEYYFNLLTTVFCYLTLIVGSVFLIIVFGYFMFKLFSRFLKDVLKQN